MDIRQEHAEEANSGRRNEGNERFRYFECLKNHAIGINRGAVDGCGEFMPSGAEGTLEALTCAACTCHRNFHRRVPEALVQPINPNHHHYHHHYHQQQAYYYHHEHHHNHNHNNNNNNNNNNNDPPSGHQGPLALVATSREDAQEEEISNHNHPSSSAGGSRKRFRTKFTPYQKDKMLVFSEGLGWRIQKEHEAAVEQFCAEIGINRQVLKVWMHNNKHTLGKKP